MVKGCFRRMERKVGYCMQCDYHEHKMMDGIHYCKHPDAHKLPLNQHNLLYIVPNECPLPNWDVDKLKPIDCKEDVDRVVDDLYDMEKRNV